MPTFTAKQKREVTERLIALANAKEDTEAKDDTKTEDESEIECAISGKRLIGKATVADDIIIPLHPHTPITAKDLNLLVMVPSIPDSTGKMIYHLYERTALESWLKTSSTNPRTRRPLFSTGIISLDESSVDLQLLNTRLSLWPPVKKNNSQKNTVPAPTVNITPPTQQASDVAFLEREKRQANKTRAEKILKLLRDLRGNETEEKLNEFYLGVARTAHDILLSARSLLKNYTSYMPVSITEPLAQKLLHQALVDAGANSSDAEKLSKVEEFDKLYKSDAQKEPGWKKIKDNFAFPIAYNIVRLNLPVAAKQGVTPSTSNIESFAETQLFLHKLNNAIKFTESVIKKGVSQKEEYALYGFLTELREIKAQIYGSNFEYQQLSQFKEEIRANFEATLQAMPNHSNIFVALLARIAATFNIKYEKTNSTKLKFEAEFKNSKAINFFGRSSENKVLPETNGSSRLAPTFGNN